MIPGLYDITIYRGGTFEIDFTAKDANGDISFGEIYDKADLTVYEAWYTSVDPTPPQHLFAMSTDDGTIIIDGNVIRLHLPANVTQGLPLVSGVYRMRLIVSGINPIVDPFMEGRLIVKN